MTYWKSKKPTAFAVCPPPEGLTKEDARHLQALADAARAQMTADPRAIEARRYYERPASLLQTARHLRCGIPRARALILAAGGVIRTATHRHRSQDIAPHVPRRRGPPSVLDDPGVRLAVVEAFRAGASVGEVAEAWGQKYCTVYRWRRDVLWKELRSE